MKTFTRILVLLAGIAMIVLGIWFLFHPGISLLTSTLMIGFLLLISGIFHTISYFSDRKSQNVSGWVLADGILSILLGFLLLFNEFDGTLTLVLLFGMWYCLLVLCVQSAHSLLNKITYKAGAGF